MHQTLKLIRLIVPLVVCFGLAPMVQAVGPDTEGNIPGANNGEGVGVLVSRTTGIWNTGSGYEALNHLTAGNQNTATGLRALFSDTMAVSTPPRAFIRSIATRAAFLTVPLALIRSRITRTATTIPPTVIALYKNTEGEAKHGHWFCCALPQYHWPRQHGRWSISAVYATLSAASIRPMAIVHSLVILTGSTTRPLAPRRSLLTLAAMRTLPTVVKRSSTTYRQRQHGVGLKAGFNATTGDGNVYIGAGMQGVAGEANNT